MSFNSLFTRIAETQLIVEFFLIAAFSVSALAILLWNLLKRHLD